MVAQKLVYIKYLFLTKLSRGAPWSTFLMMDGILLVPCVCYLCYTLVNRSICERVRDLFGYYYEYFMSMSFAGGKQFRMCDCESNLN